MTAISNNTINQIMDNKRNVLTQIMMVHGYIDNIKEQEIEQLEYFQVNFYAPTGLFDNRIYDAWTQL